MEPEDSLPYLEVPANSPSPESDFDCEFTHKNWPGCKSYNQPVTYLFSLFFRKLSIRVGTKLPHGKIVQYSVPPAHRSIFFLH